MPDDSPWPFILTVAMSVGFTAMLLQSWWAVSIAGFGVVLCLGFWVWPKRSLLQIARPGHG
jgi:cytochrome c oxidase subunit 1/cytochrome c oxidase subunit I+III